MAVTLQNESVRYVIDAAGRNRHFIDRCTGTDWLAAAPASTCCALIRKGDDEHCPSRVGWADGRLTVTFDSCLVTAVIRVDLAPRRMLFTVEALTGDADELVFVSIPTRLRVIADEPFSAGMLALNLQTNVVELPGPQQHLWAACYRRFGFAGAQAGLTACASSEMRDEFKAMVAAAPGVPQAPLGGPWALDSDLPCGSYLFGAPTEETVDDWIDLCRRINFTQIDFCGCLNYGDYQPFTQMYPDGYRSVRAVTERLHNAGILAGLHTMSFSINKTCDWVTPVPDPRLAKEQSYTLAGDIGAADDSVPFVESTAALPRYLSYYVRRSMVVQIDRELIQYTQVRNDGIAGCQRGAYGTAPAPHRRGAAVHHLKECWGAFLPDGESTLFDEVARRIATVINECGFDFTYLDGLDGAHVIGGEENRWHYGAKFAFAVYAHLARPTMVEMATFHHHLWFVRSRMQAWDHTIRGHKKFIDLHCRSNEGCRRIFMPRHLGWSRVLAWVDHGYEVTFDDDVEYMWCKGLGNDSGYSLQAITPEMVALEPWTHQMLPIIARYERLRRDEYFPESVKARLRVPGAEFTLRQAADGEWEFVPRQYLRHKVESLDGPTNVWQVSNDFGAQPLKLRIQALMSAGPYDAPDNIVLADFSEAGEFSDSGMTEVILNSGRMYAYPAAAPGLVAEITPSTAYVRVGDVSGRWTATNSGAGEPVASSAPDDGFSLEDHAERIFRPRQDASWVRCGKIFAQPVDLTGREGLGVWIHGDGQGELINIRPGTPSAFDTAEADHYVTVDFVGWRYFELIEPESDRFEDYSWPYGRSLYKQYRQKPPCGSVGRLNLWYNNVPRGRTVTCYLSPIKALPLISNRIERPAITLGGRTVIFPVEIESGAYLEFYGAGECRLYGPKRELQGTVRPEGEIPMLAHGLNELAFSCRAGACRPRANITVITASETPLRR